MRSVVAQRDGLEDDLCLRVELLPYDPENDAYPAWLYDEPHGSGTEIA